MDDVRTLLEISLTAQFQYILQRIDSKKDIREFDNASQYILSCIFNVPNYDDLIEYNLLGLEEFENKMAKNCLDLYRETRNLLQQRFLTGRSKETVLEKL